MSDAQKVREIAMYRLDFDPVNELRVAAKVTEIIESDAAQALAAAKRYASISYAAPLIFVKANPPAPGERAQQFTAYEYAEGFPPVDPETEQQNVSDEELGRIREFINDLSQLLEEGGIDAEDIKVQNLLLERRGGKTHVKLTDAEYFHSLVV